MADLGTMTAGSGADGGERDGLPARRVRRARGLPGGRAVVGALLITAAAVGVFATYLRATAEPGTRYAVATEAIEVGTRIESEAMVAELFEFVPIDLPDGVRARAVREAQASQLVGRVVAAPVERDDPLLATAVVDDAGAPGAEKLSFSLPAADAVGGTLDPGQRIDVLATYGSGAEAWTAFVARGVLVVDVTTPGDGMAAGDEVTLTVAVSTLEDVQALGHAVRTAEVLVTRSTATTGDTAPAPPPYAPSRDAAPPEPDPLDAGARGGDDDA